MVVLVNVEGLRERGGSKRSTWVHPTTLGVRSTLTRERRLPSLLSGVSDYFEQE